MTVRNRSLGPLPPPPPRSAMSRSAARASATTAAESVARKTVLAPAAAAHGSIALRYADSGSQARHVRAASTEAHESPCRTCKPITVSPASSAAASPLSRAATSTRSSRLCAGRVSSSSKCDAHQKAPKCRHGLGIASPPCVASDSRRSWARLSPIAGAAAPAAVASHVGPSGRKKHPRSRRDRPLQRSGERTPGAFGVCSASPSRIAIVHGLSSDPSIDEKPERCNSRCTVVPARHRSASAPAASERRCDCKLARRLRLVSRPQAAISRRDGSSRRLFRTKSGSTQPNGTGDTARKGPTLPSPPLALPPPPPPSPPPRALPLPLPPVPLLPTPLPLPPPLVLVAPSSSWPTAQTSCSKEPRSMRQCQARSNAKRRRYASSASAAQEAAPLRAPFGPEGRTSREWKPGAWPRRRRSQRLYQEQSSSVGE
mmetsp:Transcript_47310/g.154961  ORF Transcript_47310/g.154961 Transcript_47310/m.154961 type:complete len:429 (-) Transcript_47310:469-1755(-)